MADDKRGRDKQARDADRRQRERAVAAELERMDETEPPVEEADLGDLETGLDAVAFPASGAEVLDAVGDLEIDGPDGTVAVADLVPDTDEVRFESASDVRVRVRRPTVAGAMTRVEEASDELRDADLSGSKRTAYEKTFRALASVEADDDDEGVGVVADWTVGRIRDDETLPSSRDVRREAARFCRENGYQVGNDQWLGI